MTDTLKKLLTIVCLLLALAGLGYVAHRIALSGAVATARAEEQAKANQKLLEASEAFRRRENQMVVDADRLRKEKDAQIKALDSRLAAVLGSLQQRPSRNSPEAPADSADGQAGTGASLSREDAEFLAREAARADGIRLALDQCYRQYDSIRETLK